MKPLCVADFRSLARRRLPPFLFEYIDGGSYAELTLRRNVSDLEAIALRQRVLRDVGTIDLSATLLGRRASMPVALGPVGLAGMNARRGEVQAAKAAEAAGIPFCLSTVSACGLKEVAAGLTRPFWFQLYAIRDRDFLRDMIARARGLGCDALLFTVDLPVPGVRYRDHRSGLAGAASWWGAARRFGQALAHPRWAWDVGVRGRPHNLGNVAPVLGASSGLEDFLGWIAANFDPSVTWRDLDWLRSEWPGPLVVKGILDAEDAREALANGVDGIVVSNHGGRQLDGVLSTAAALPAVAAAIDGRTTILVDGGIRSGLDVVRMLALGADGVLLGRAWAYALAAQGGRGVARMLELLESEMRVAMALTGARSVAEIGPHCLA
jgi:L-lactate dehydrogenase (cytochrome)